MILCFSGTGNSRYAAQRIARICDDELSMLNEPIKRGCPLHIDSADKPLVIVAPSYAWRLPRLLEEYLDGCALPKGLSTYFVLSCGGQIGDAAKYNQRLCQRKGLRYMGTAQIVMPENYLALFEVPDMEEARRIIAAAEPDIEAAAACIKAGEALPAPRRNLLDRCMSTLINPVFYRFCVGTKKFRVGDGCTGCGLCARLCPTNCLRMAEADGAGELSGGKMRPLWSAEGCTHCMACIAHCPAAAIEYGTKSVGQTRYHID